MHDLQPLNAVSIKDAAVPPFVDHVAESFAGRACCSVFDLYVAFDQRKLDPRSRDMTTFQTPLGTFRLTSIPMGYTNSFQIMHNDVTFILQDEIPNTTIPFADDIGVKGPATRYEKPDGTYETIEGNPGIRRFVWEHMEDCARVVSRIGAVGGTISGKKVTLCAPHGVIVGQKCTYEGRVPEDSKVEKIRNWPEPRNLTELRGFLGTCGVVRTFIKDYARIAKPLVHLTRKGVEFEIGEEERSAMQTLKDAVVNSPALRPIDYESEEAVILAVDSSIIGFGYVLYQEGTVNGRRVRFVSRFGSGNWNERESNYSQPKIELYGLLRALKAVRVHIIGVKNLVVEVDAKYIKGMINNPDIQPNATINRWIAGILLFDFKLVHVPGTQHGGPDGLSRRFNTEEEEKEEEPEGNHEHWIDDMYCFAQEGNEGEGENPIAPIPL